MQLLLHPFIPGQWVPGGGWGDTHSFEKPLARLVCPSAPPPTPGTVAHLLLRASWFQVQRGGWGQGCGGGGAALWWSFAGNGQNCHGVRKGLTLPHGRWSGIHGEETGWTGDREFLDLRQGMAQTLVRPQNVLLSHKGFGVSSQLVRKVSSPLHLPLTQGGHL